MFDGWATANGIEYVEDLPPSRFVNLVHHLLTYGRDDKAVRKVEAWLAKPLPGLAQQRTFDERSPWSVDNEMSAFRAAQGIVSTTQNS